MKQEYSLAKAIGISVLFTCVLWWIKFVEMTWGVDFSPFGVVPEHWWGLRGVLWAPLIHGSLTHLFSNTLPSIFLLTLLVYGYPQTRWWVILLIWLGSGFGVWLYAREATHIGASGLTHGVFFFLLVASILRRDSRSVAIMMIVFFLYGGMIWGIFPREEHISFEYHFFGALMGVISAFLFWRRDPKPVEKRYAWEDHPDDDDPIIGQQWQEQENPSESQTEDSKPHQQ